MNSTDSADNAAGKSLVSRLLWPMAVGNYAVCVVLALQHARFAGGDPLLAQLFLLLVCISYPAVYVGISSLPVWLAAGAVRALRGHLPPRGLDAALTALAIPCFSTAPLLLFVDLRVFDVIGFHLNGFVWNLLLTPGGIESMGASGAAFLSLAALIGCALVAEGIVFAILLRRTSSGSRWLEWLRGRRTRIWAASILLLAGAGERLLYGASDLRDYSPLLRHADALPLYLPFTFKRLARKLGIDAVARADFTIPRDASALHYPAQPLVGALPADPPNVVWLCAESLRADAITAQGTPALWRLAQESVWFRNHLSGGNGTRMGVFGMFTGLPGNYWFSFLRENRGPVLIDWLVDSGYQLEIFTSDDFTYPEFRQTLFVRIPEKHLHEAQKGRPTWQRDRETIGALVDFLARRDTAQPFFVFAFLESPHARYEFPPESAIATPYLEQMNYVSMDLQRDIELIRNRYLNSVNHLDTQIARVLESLESLSLSQSTILIVTGDHGEEFLEKGHWGHGSSFSEEQIHVPLLIRAPGEAARHVDRLTSHLDLPGTLLSKLGVRTPASSYSEGLDLFGPERRSFAVLADWNTIGLVDDAAKIRLPMKTFGMGRSEVTARNDAAVPDAAKLLRDRTAQLGELVRSLGRFRAQNPNSGDGR